MESPMYPLVMVSDAKRNGHHLSALKYQTVIFMYNQIST